MSLILSIDPGKDKCGIALFCKKKGVIDHKVISTSSFKEEISSLLTSFSPDIIIIGSGTGSKQLKGSLKEITNVALKTVDERHTTEQAKFRYFKDNPPKGIKKFIPLGLLLPPVPYDDYAAILLAEKYIKEIEGGNAIL